MKGKPPIQMTTQSAPLELQRVATEEDVSRIARELSDGARRTLATLILLCPKPFDTTGVTKFSGDQKTARMYLVGELQAHNLVGKRIAQERLNIFPTELARSVHALLRACN